MALSAAATTTTAMLHAISILAAWPWLVMVAINYDTVDRVAERIPQKAIDELGGMLRGMRMAFRRWVEAALVWETVRNGLTPTAKAVVKPKVEYLMGLNKTGAASRAVKDAQDAHEEALRAAQESRRRLREAKKEFRATKKTLEALKKAYDDVMVPRQKELVGARFGVRDKRAAAEKAQRVFANDLRARCAGELHGEAIEAAARRLNVSASYLRTLLGEQSKRDLTAEETQDIVERGLAGTPAGILAAEYHISRQRAHQILREHKIIRNGAPG